MTKTTTAMTHPTYQPSQFTMTKTLGCISASNKDPTPISFLAGDGLYTAICNACKTLVGTSAKYLETGLPYVSEQLPNGRPVLIDLQVRKGGFSATNTHCYDQLVLVLRGCRSGNPSRTFGDLFVPILRIITWKFVFSQTIEACDYVVTINWRTVSGTPLSLCVFGGIEIDC